MGGTQACPEAFTSETPVFVTTSYNFDLNFCLALGTEAPVAVHKGRREAVSSEVPACTQG